MTRLEERLRRELDEIADRATTSTDALEQLRSSAAQHRDQAEQEVVIMLMPSDGEPRRPRWIAVTALAAAAVGVLAVGGAIVLRDNESIDEPGAPLRRCRSPQALRMTRPCSASMIIGCAIG